MNFYCQSTIKGSQHTGVIGDMSKKYSVSRKTISRIWGHIKHQQQQNQFPINVNSKRIGKKSRTEIPFDGTKFKGLEKAKKTSQTVVARAMGVSQSTIWRWKKKKCIRKHTNAIKPLLNDKNKLDRLIFCLTSCILDEHTCNFKFNDMSI